jgi:hypothetical protein
MIELIEASSLLDGVLELLRNPRPTKIKHPDGRVDYDGIRKVYAANMADVMLRKGWIDPYFADWPSIFTPIEMQMWFLVRAHSTPYYPQFPVGRFFVDFGNPHKRLAIECDGRRWHDPDRDLKRDTELLEEHGWTVVRFSGRACYRMEELPDLRSIPPLAGVDYLPIQNDEDLRYLN